jgi:hypothetical protein
MAKESKTKTVIGKVQVTAMFRDWWESDLSDIFTEPQGVKIISAVEYSGGLYLIYTHEVEE